MLDAYAIVQAQTALQLTDAQYGQFVTRLKRLQETRRRSGQARNRLLQQLRRSPPRRRRLTSAAIRERLKALRDHDEQTAAAMRRDSEALDEVLDARQQAPVPAARGADRAAEARPADAGARAGGAPRRGAAPQRRAAAEPTRLT